MLPRVHRFSRRNFEKLRARMKSFRSGDFLFLYSPSRGHLPKYAAVISKKVDKRAVARNQHRRRLYEDFAQYCLQPNLPFNVIGLYKGSQMPENRADYTRAVEKLAQFLSKK